MKQMRSARKVLDNHTVLWRRICTTCCK